MGMNGKGVDLTGTDSLELTWVFCPCIQFGNPETRTVSQIAHERNPDAIPVSVTIYAWRSFTTHANHVLMRRMRLCKLDQS